MYDPVSGGTVSFTATVDFLLPPARAYAVNVAGVGYGQNIPIATSYVGDEKTQSPRLATLLGRGFSR